MTGAPPGFSGRGARDGGGFTLVELMVALTMGIFIVLALLTLLVNVNRNNNEMARTNAVIENGRFGLQLLEADLSHAGFWGGFVPQFDDLSLKGSPADPPSSVPDPCLAYTAANWDTSYVSGLIGIPVQVYEVSGAGIVPAVGTCAASMFAHAQKSSHIIVVRHVAPCRLTPGSAPIIDEDCTKQANALYFQLGRGSATPAPDYVLAQASDANLANFFSTSPLYDADGTTVAAVYKFVSHIYFVRDYSTAPGDGIPTLMRYTFKVSGTTPQWVTSGDTSLIEGIQSLRIELALDETSKSGIALAPSDFNSAVTWSDANVKVTPQNRGDGNPESSSFQGSSAGAIQCGASTPCTAFDLMNAVGAKLYVMARATSATPQYLDEKTYSMGIQPEGTEFTLGPYGDAFKRHVYLQTIRFTNVAMRRDVP